MLAILQSDPSSPIYQYGASTGSAVICIGLYIWSQIQIGIFKNTVEANTKAITESNSELKVLIVEQSRAQDKLSEAVHQLAEAIKTQVDGQQQQLEIIRDMSSEQRVMSSNQLTIMNSFQRIVEQLISTIKEGR